MVSIPQSVWATLEKAAREALWGSITVHFRGGAATNIATRRTLRPGDAATLASQVQSLSGVAEVVASGDDNLELIIVRYRGKELRLVAVESNSNIQEEHGHQGQQSERKDL